MTNKLFTNAFEKTKDFIWNHTHKDAAKMLIGMGALGFALSSMGQCFAIHINDKISKKKKDFLLLQETADGVVNIGLFLGITSGIWKLSDRILKHLGFVTQNTLDAMKNNPQKINHVVSGGRIVTTMIASVLACNVITPLIRNRFAGKVRQHVEKRHLLQGKNTPQAAKVSSVGKFQNLEGWNKKTISEMYKTPVYYSNSGSMKV